MPFALIFQHYPAECLRNSRRHLSAAWVLVVRRLELSGGGAAYGGVDDSLVAGIIVDVDGDAAQGRYLSGEVVESRVVLAFGLVSGCVVTAAGE